MKPMMRRFVESATSSGCAGWTATRQYPVSPQGIVSMQERKLVRHSQGPPSSPRMAGPDNLTDNLASRQVTAGPQSPAMQKLMLML